MSLVILSYRENYTHTCGRSCGCVHARNDSDFSAHLAKDEEEAASYLARRLMEDEDASYANLVFSGWSHLTHFADCQYGSATAKGIESIRVHGASPSYEDEEDTGAVIEEEKRVESLHERIVELTRTKLEAHKKAKADEKAAKERAENAKRNEEILRREQADYERLKSKFEPKS